MASVTILSDNGATSGSAGLKTSGGNDGVLLLQTTTSGGTPTTAISISNTQVVTYTNQPTYTGGTANGVLYLNGSKAVTSGTALVFDGTNLGLGVTPNTWYSTWKAFQGVSLAIAGNTELQQMSSAYFNAAGSFIYASSSYKPTRYQAFDGSHQWYTAGLGTVGNTVSFTQAMTLDASGNLGIATTSPSTFGKVTIRGGITVTSGSTSLTGSSFSASDNSNSTFYITHSSGSVNLVADTPLAFWAQGSTGPVERARIDSSGRMATPYQTGFGAYGTNSNWSVPTGGGIVPYDVAAYNTGSNYNTSTYTFTAPVAGKYFVSFSALIYPNSIPSTQYITMYASVNGSTTYSGAVPMARMSFKENQTTMGSYGVLNLSANDTVAIRADATTTGLTLYLSSGHASFFIYFLG